MRAGLLAAPPPAADRLFGDLLPTLGILVVIVLVGGGIALFIRRRLQAGGDGSGVGFTLGDLRDMHARGEMSDEEFERAKSQMIAGLSRSASTPSEASPMPGSRVRGAVPPARSDQGDGNGRNGSPAPDGKE